MPAAISPAAISSWTVDIRVGNSGARSQNSEVRIRESGVEETKRVFFSDLTLEALQYLIRSHLLFHL
jgi:hypothetical protein